MCSRVPVVLDGEDGDYLNNKINKYIVQQGALTEAEKDQATIAATAFVAFERAEAADRAADLRSALNYEARREADESRAVHAQVQRLEADPMGTMIELKDLPEGLTFALDEIDVVMDRLGRYGFLPPYFRRRAVQLMGRDPRHLLTDPFVGQFIRNCLGAAFASGELTAAKAAWLLDIDRPDAMDETEFEKHLEQWLPQLPPRDQARRNIMGALMMAREALAARLHEVKDRDETDRRLGRRQAGVATDKDAARVKRYKVENARVSRQALDQLMKLQKMRLQHGDALANATEEAGEPTSGAPEGAPAVAASGPETAVEEGDRTEATSNPGDGVSTEECEVTQEDEGVSGGLCDANPSSEDDEFGAAAAPEMGPPIEAPSPPQPEGQAPVREAAGGPLNEVPGMSSG